MVRPAKPYFLVRIAKKEQKERLQKTGMFYNPVEVFMKRNMQSGEIVAIGEKAKEVFPEAKEGNILIFHHFVEGDTESRKDSLVFEDEDFNYYVISSYMQNGKDTECYGVWDGHKITPHPDYIILQSAPPVKELPKDDFINQALREVSIPGSNSTLFLFNEYNVTREDKLETLSRLKREVMELSKSRMTKEISHAIQDKEHEMEAISQEINKTTYKPYTIAYVNKIVSEWFDRPVKSDDTIYCLNAACQTEVEFMDKTYIMCESKYIGFMLSNN